MTLSDEHPEFFNGGGNKNITIGNNDKDVTQVNKFKPYKNDISDPIKSAIATFNENIKLNDVPAVAGCFYDGKSYNMLCSLRGKYIHNVSGTFDTPEEFVNVLRGIASILEERLKEENNE